MACAVVLLSYLGERGEYRDCSPRSRAHCVGLRRVGCNSAVARCPPSSSDQMDIAGVCCSAAEYCRPRAGLCLPTFHRATLARLARCKPETFARLALPGTSATRPLGKPARVCIGGHRIAGRLLRVGGGYAPTRRAARYVRLQPCSAGCLRVPARHSVRTPNLVVLQGCPRKPGDP